MESYLRAHEERALFRDFKRYTEKTFPDYRYVPGINPHPTRDEEGHSFGIEEGEIESWSVDEWEENEEYLYGIDLYNNHYYWESHEAWEGLWRAVKPHSNPHKFTQGLIKLSASILKIRMAKQVPMDLVGAQRLAKSGFALLEPVKEYKKIYMGVEIQTHLKRMKKYLEPVLNDEIIEVNNDVPIIELKLLDE